MDQSSKHSAQYGAIHELVAASLDGRLCTENMAKLESLLSESPEVRRIYFDYLAETAILRTWASRPIHEPSVSVDESVIRELLEEAEEAERLAAEEQVKKQAARNIQVEQSRRETQEIARRKAGRRPEAIVIPRNVAYLGAAAIATSVLWIAFTISRPGDADLASSNLPLAATLNDLPLVATLTGSTDAELVALPKGATAERGLSVSMIAGTRLISGSYELTRGVVGIDFDGGVSTLVEAPATIELTSTDQIRLTRGRLVGLVPPVAIGFTVETPTATIVDLGTEFGISIAKGQAADISVFDGEVDVVAGRSTDQQAPQQRRLTVGTSIRVDVKGKFVPAETSENLYLRALPTERELEQKIAYERWLNYSTKLAADPDVVAYYTFNNQEPSDKLLQNSAGDATSSHGDIQGAKWSEGRWPQKQGLRFASSDAKDDSDIIVRLDFPDSFDELTLAAWVNIDRLLGGRNTLLVTETYGQSGQVHWQISSDGRMHLGIAETGNRIDDFNADAAVPFTGLKKWPPAWPGPETGTRLIDSKAPATLFTRDHDRKDVFVR